MQRHSFKTHPRDRKDEKLDMLYLNQRLETYLGSVRLLEGENELLRREIKTLKGCSQGGQLGLDDKLRLARQEVQEAWREKDRVELELGSLGEELQILGLQRQWVAGAHGEVKKKLKESRKQMEEEERAQVWLRGRVSQLEEQVQFQIQTHQEDVANQKDALIHIAPPPAQTGTQLPNLQEMAEEYTQVAVSAWQEAAVLYQGQVDSLEKSLSQARNRLVQVGQEKTESLTQLQALENELASAQDKWHYLEKSVSQQKDNQRQEIQNLQAHLEVLEMEKEALGDQIDGLLIESRGLLQLKMSLGMEVATYRALLDNENLTGNFSSTNYLRRISTSGSSSRETSQQYGVHSPRGVRQIFQTQMAANHRDIPVSTIRGISPQSSSPNCVTVNKTLQSFEKTEEQPVSFNIEAKQQPCWATPYPKVPQNGIAVDHFRPQDVNEEVNYAEPLSPHTEEAGDDFRFMHASTDLEAQSIWDREKEEEDQDIVKTWPAEEKTMIHQDESFFTLPSDGQTLCSPSVSYGNPQSYSSVIEAHSDFSKNYENDGTFERSYEKEEPFPDPVYELKEGHMETTGEYAEYVENTSSEAFECGVGEIVHNNPKELKQEKDISYNFTQPFHRSEEEFHHVRRLEEDVVSLTKDCDEKDIATKYEIPLEDELHPDGYLKNETLKRLEGLNEKHYMTTVIDEISQLEHFSYEIAQTSRCTKEIGPQVGSDLNLPGGDEISDMTNQLEESDELSPNGNVTVGWEEVGCLSEKNDTRERMDGHKEGNDHLQEEEMLREPQANQTKQNVPADEQKRNVDEKEHILSGEKHYLSEPENVLACGEKHNLSEQENVLSGGEKTNVSEQENVLSGGEKLNVSEQEQTEECHLSTNDKELEDDTPSTSISGRATELMGNSSAQENTLADTRPLIRYQSDETDANTQASYMGESDASDGEEDREIGQTGLCTLGGGKFKRFDTMEDLHEESEGHAMDQDGTMGSTQTDGAIEYGSLGNNDKHAVDPWNQKAEEEQFYEERATTGGYSNIYTEEDYNEEKIDRLVEQELENLSISSYSEHFIGPISKSGSVLSLQAKDTSSEEVEQIHSENLNQSDKIPEESEEKPSGREKPSQSEKECIPSEAMSSLHSRVLMTSEHTPLRGNSVEMSQTEYLAQDVFRMEIRSDHEPDKKEENDQKDSLLNNANPTKDHSIHSKTNSRPGIPTDINKSDIEESNSSDDDSPNVSQCLEPVSRAHVARDQEDLLDVAISRKRHSLEDCTTPLQSTVEVTNDQTIHEDLQTDKGEVFESSNKHPESEAPFAGNKKGPESSPKINSKDQGLFRSSEDNHFWGSNLETGDTYQHLQPHDHVTKQSNQKLASANNLVWGDLENQQTASWNTDMDNEITKVSAIEEDEQLRPPKVMQPLYTDMVVDLNVALDNEGDPWSLGDE